MVMWDNLRVVVLLGSILLSLEFLGNWAWEVAPVDWKPILVVVAFILLGAGIYFHILRE